MKHEDIIALINAGFDADEIRLMMSEPEQEPSKEPEPVKETEPVKDTESATAPEQDDRFVDYMRSIEALRQEVENLRSTFSTAAVRMDNINQPAQENVSDVLASIINPRTKKEV